MGARWGAAVAGTGVTLGFFMRFEAAAGLA